MQIIFVILNAIIFAIIAKERKRSILVWGFIGALTFLIIDTALYLAISANNYDSILFGKSHSLIPIFLFKIFVLIFIVGIFNATLDFPKRSKPQQATEHLKNENKEIKRSKLRDIPHPLENKKKIIIILAKTGFFILSFLLILLLSLCVYTVYKSKEFIILEGVYNRTMSFGFSVLGPASLRVEDEYFKTIDGVKYSLRIMPGCYIPGITKSSKSIDLVELGKVGNYIYKGKLVSNYKKNPQFIAMIYKTGKKRTYMIMNLIGQSPVKYISFNIISDNDNNFDKLYTFEVYEIEKLDNKH